MNITSAIDYLSLLLRRLAVVDDDALLISNEERVEVPNDVWTTMLQLKIVQQTQPAKSIICDGCEENCVRPVVIYQANAKSPARAFIVCDVREDGGRINVDFERLKQWQVSEQQLAEMIAKLCGITQAVVKQNHIWTLGIFVGKKHQAVLLLDFGKNALLVNDIVLPLAELISFTSFALNIDTSKITQAADLGLAPAGKIQNRAIRKSKTQTRNEGWKKEYQKFMKNNPDKSDSWISIQIEKMPIADGKNRETIRKNMK